MNIINKVFNKLKLMFSRKSEELLFEPKLNEENKKQIEIQNENQKKLEDVNNNKEKQILYNVEIGDIIWAKRYNNEIEKQQIAIGHQEGPYIVIGKSKNKFICSQGTSTEPENKYMHDYLEYGPSDYNLTKKTYFKINKFEFINNSSFINRLDSLKKEDLEKILGMMKQKNSYYISKNSNWIKMKISSGDIIRIKNRNYVVINVKENVVECVRLKSNEFNIKIDDLRYLDYGNLFEFNINDSIEYKATLNSTLLAYIKKRGKEYRKNCENQTITQRGSIILKNEKLYYVYGEEGQKWLIFEISKKCSNLSDEITIKRSTYYTEYYSKQIDKKDEFETVYCAFPEEIDEIRNNKKTYKYRLEDIKKDNKIKMRVQNSSRRKK